jgi:hypothetical protein
MEDERDDKSIIAKTIQTAKHIGNIASQAARKALELEPLKPGDRVMIMPLMDPG